MLEQHELNSIRRTARQMFPESHERIQKALQCLKVWDTPEVANVALGSVALLVDIGLDAFVCLANKQEVGREDLAAADELLATARRIQGNARVGGIDTAITNDAGENATDRIEALNAAVIDYRMEA